jgi:hypothetical protein
LTSYEDEYDSGMTRYVIRKARPEELAIVSRHRRRMYEDMGDTDPVQLEEMERASTPFFGQVLGERIEDDAQRDRAYSGRLRLPARSEVSYGERKLHGRADHYLPAPDGYLRPMGSTVRRSTDRADEP